MFQVILLSMKPSNTWEVIGCIMNTNYKHSLKYIEYPIVSSNMPMHQSPTSLWMIGAQQFLLFSEVNLGLSRDLSQIQILIPSALFSTESGL